MKLNTADLAILAAAAFVGIMVLRARKTVAASPATPNVRTGIDWANTPINGLF